MVAAQALSQASQTGQPSAVGAATYTLCLCSPQLLSQKTPDILVHIKERN